MLSLFKSERFQNEYKNFQERCDKITNENVKADVQNMLGRLANEVRKIDIQHTDFFAKNQINLNTVDSKMTVTELRREIDRRLADWEKAQKL